jgi:thiol-disulfide isomerase/thioredoxin
MRAGLLALALIIAVPVAHAIAEDARPELPSFQLADLKGQVFELADYRGTVTLLNFWAYWCGPCRAELPELQKVYNSYAGKGFAVIAVAVDTPREMVKPFMDRLGVTLPVAFVNPLVQRDLGIEQLPFSVLVDKNGKVARVYPGFAPAMIDDMRVQVSKLLKEPKQQGGK